MPKLNKHFMFKLDENQEKKINDAFTSHLKETGEYITKSEMVRRALDNHIITLMVRGPTPVELYEGSIRFLTQFVQFLYEVKQYLIRKNNNTVTVVDQNEALIWKYFLSVIIRVDDSRILGGNVYSLQTLASIERALFESAVDLTLLNRGPVSNFDKMRAWDRLALIKHARKIAAYVKQHKINLNDTLYSPLKIHVDHVSNTKAIEIEVVQLKKTIGNKKPKTWTGQNDLEKNAKMADKLRGYGFDKDYYTRYTLLCMDTHGSGVAGLGTTDPNYFMGRCLFSYLNIIKWATVCYYESFSFMKKLDDVHLLKLSNIFHDSFLDKHYPELTKLVLSK